MRYKVETDTYLYNQHGTVISTIPGGTEFDYIADVHGTDKIRIKWGEMEGLLAASSVFPVEALTTANKLIAAQPPVTDGRIDATYAKYVDSVQAEINRLKGGKLTTAVIAKLVRHRDELRNRLKRCATTTVQALVCDLAEERDPRNWIPVLQAYATYTSADELDVPGDFARLLNALRPEDSDSESEEETPESLVESQFFALRLRYKMTENPKVDMTNGVGYSPFKVGEPNSFRLRTDSSPRDGTPWDGTLYIGGRPHVADIRQGDLGDCYLLSVLTAMARHDPKHIQRMITLPSPATALGRLWLRVEKSSQLIMFPVEVRLDTNLAYTRDNVLVGARVRVCETASPQNQSPTVEMAMWVPLLEKMYAAFATKHGLNGIETTPTRAHDTKHKDGSKEEVEEKPEREDEPERLVLKPARFPSDYDTIARGAKASHPIYRIMYGPRFIDSRGVALSAAAESFRSGVADAGSAGPALLRFMLLTEAQSSGTSTQGPPADRIVLGATAQSSAHAARSLGDAIQQYTKAAGQQAQEALRELAAAVAKIPTVTTYNPYKDLTLQKQVYEVYEQVLADLDAQGEHGRTASRLAKLLSAVHLPTSDTCCHVLGDHDYAVLDCAVAFTSNPPQPRPTPATLVTGHQTVTSYLRHVDLDASSITLYNPHGMRSGCFTPVPNDGVFTLTLADYLESFETLGFAEIRVP